MASVGCVSCVNAQFFTVRVRVTADIRNNPAASLPAGWGGANVISPPLEGDFGPTSVSITWLVADDPDNLLPWFVTSLAFTSFQLHIVLNMILSACVFDRYSPGDTITVVFNQATNLAGLPATNIRPVNDTIEYWQSLTEFDWSELKLSVLKQETLYLKNS